MRLGEAMVKEGLITNELLGKALERQIIFGGRLGTNLVEMGAVHEETLARFLGKMFGIPYAAPERFNSVPQDVLDSFPKELAVKYTAFPINKERNWLHLAMKDPNDIAILDELSFVVGLNIKPYIASEIRIAYAHEKYYGVKRDLRYVAVAEDESSSGPAGQAAAKAQQKPKAAEEQKAKPEEYLGDESQVNIYGQGADMIFGGHGPQLEVASPHEFMEALAAQSTAPAPPVQAAPPVQPAPPVQQTPVQPAPAYQPPAQQQPVEPQPFPAYEPPVPPAQPQAQPVQPAPPAMNDPYEMLANPVDRDHVAVAIVAAANREAARAVLFMVKGGVITGWKGAGLGITDRLVDGLSVQLDKPTIFKEVVEDKVFYKGPILQIPENLQLMTALGGVIPQEAVACPLVIRGKVMGVLYCDNGPGAMIKGDVGRLEGLMAKASMSLEILILKTKILADA